MRITEFGAAGNVRSSLVAEALARGGTFSLNMASARIGSIADFARDHTAAFTRANDN